MKRVNPTKAVTTNAVVAKAVTVLTALAGRFRRLNASERALLGAGTVLLASLFFKWFGESFAAGDLPLGEVTASGWEALPWIRWVLLGTALLAIAVPVAVAAGLSVKLTVPPAVFVAIAGGTSYLLILWRVVDPPDGYGERGIAAFVALIAAAVIAYAGNRSMEAAGVTFRAAADRLAVRRPDSDRRSERRAHRATPPPPPSRKRDPDKQDPDKRDPDKQDPQ